jgi:5-methylthioadenosine/S-adenosylhomocysteine deaminase
LGLDGVIREGACADLAILDLSGPTLSPLHNPVSQVVYAAHGGHVSSTIIDGVPLMLERSFPTFDAHTIITGAQQVANQLVDF